MISIVDYDFVDECFVLNGDWCPLSIALSLCSDKRTRFTCLASNKLRELRSYYEVPKKNEQSQGSASV